MTIQKTEERLIWVTDYPNHNIKAQLHVTKRGISKVLFMDFSEAGKPQTLTLRVENLDAFINIAQECKKQFDIINDTHKE